jgi:hypothetical protein
MQFRFQDEAKILYVEWIDANSHAGWQDRSEIAKDASVSRCYSIGFVIKETKEELVIATTVSDDEANCWIAIPKSWIRKRRKLEV